MVCWYKCCPLIFRKNKPKRLQFKWDITAMLILTAHDIVASFIVVAASILAEDDKPHQYAPYNKMLTPISVFAMLICNFLIIYCMIEHGFRLLEDGPWYGKVTIGVLHVAPSIAYIAIVQKNFIYYMGFTMILPPGPGPSHHMTVADIFGDVYGISVFHHIYVVLFESILTFVMVVCCSKKKVSPQTSEKIEDLPPYEEVVMSNVQVKLQLDSDSRVFIPGDEIKGSLIFSSQMEHPPSATIDIVGTSEVSWIHKQFCKKGMPLKATETVFNYTVVTADVFQTILPTNVPPTFACGEATQASISYCIIATLSMDGSPNFTIQLPFVVRPAQITTSPLPVEHSVFTEKMYLSRYLGCIPYKPGPYGFSLDLPKLNYIIGEDIDFSVEIFNDSRRPILKVAASLVSVVDLMDATHGFSFKDELLMVWDELTYGPMPLRGVEEWIGKLTVPKIAPESSRLPLSKGIQFTKYYFRFLVEIQGIFENAELEVPISIGPSVQGRDWLEGHSQSTIDGGETKSPQVSIIG